MAEIGYRRYEDWNLSQKYAWMQGGQGAEAAAAAHRFLGETANGYAESDNALKRSLDGMVEWRGSAATAAAAALQKAAQWVVGAGTAGRTGSGSVDRYGGSFAETKPKIQAPDEVGAWGFGDYAKAAFVGSHTVMVDQLQKIEANTAKEKEADRALYAHEAATRDAVAQFPQLEPPAPMTNAAPTVSTGGGGGMGIATGGSGAIPTTSGGAGLPGGGIGPGAGGVGPGNVPTAPTGGPIPTTGGPSPMIPPAGRGTSPPGGSGAGLGPVRPGGGLGSGGGGAGALAGRLGSGGGGTDTRPGVRGGATNPASAASRAAGTGGFMYPPWAGGGNQGNDREHRNRYAIPSDEAFHPELPVHVPPVLGER